MENLFYLRSLTVDGCLQLYKASARCSLWTSYVIFERYFGAMHDFLNRDGWLCALRSGLIFLRNMPVRIAYIFIFIIFRAQVLYSVAKHLISVVFVKHEEHSRVLEGLDKLRDHQVWVIDSTWLVGALEVGKGCPDSGRWQLLLLELSCSLDWRCPGVYYLHLFE